MKMTNESKPYKKFAQGIFIVKSKNGSFNSDFSGLPRRLPDKEGTIYATDKALKYCIRKYLHDKGEKVFVWRRDDGKGDPINLKENYESFCKELKIEPDLKKADNKAVLVNLLKALDSRLFGVTFAMNSSDEKEKKNVSVTGSAQISYGINKLKESQFYNNQIMSPYKNKDSDKQRTLGSETKTLEAHYVYDFIVNPNNLISDIEFVDEKERTNLLLSGQDVGNFKEAICKGVNYVNSASKIGCEGELLIFIETETEEENGKLRGLLLPLMKDLVEVKEGEKEITEIDVSKLFDNLPSYLSDKKVASIEIYYDSNFTNLVGIKESSNLQIKRKNIVTLEEIK